MANTELIEQLDALLPQTQCRQCGYGACRPYAAAMAAGQAGANQCPPGGDATVRALSSLLGVAHAPVNPRYGATKPAAVALIDEASCIGCTLCIKACPVDAIIGAAKFMHTVIGAECTGCELCLPPCPVNCIAMLPVSVKTDDERRAAAHHAKRRFEARELRLARVHATAARDSALKTAAIRKRRTIARAIERARERMAQKRKAD